MSLSSSSSSISEEELKQQQKSHHLQTLQYHQQTKHHFTKYAKGPGRLDWANQPNPFRRYIDAPLISLQHFPIEEDEQFSGGVPLYSSVFLSLPPPKTISFSSFSQFFYDSLALSAWKTTGFSTWSLRVNPSSGNLHPTEAYIIAPAIGGLSNSGFVAHYAPKEHGLEIRAEIPAGFFDRCFPDDCFFVGFSSIFWREAWKYGERAFRYWFDDLEKLFGFESFPKLPIPSRPVKEFSKLDWKGEPNVLSKEHVVWDVIYKTSEAVKKPLLVGERLIIDPFQCSGVCSDSSYKELTVREVVRKRRSAVDMDGTTVIHRDTFYQILLHCLPSGSRSGEKQGKPFALPFRALSRDSEVHAALFVHRVSGLPKGLYFLVRNENHFDDLRKAMRPEFTWRKPEGCPVDLPLYELAPGDCKELSKRLSCHQDIAGDGCFSLGMISHFEPTLQAKGAWMYPRLFWETGVLGQVLYLEAHAVGISATGIGCFFDDPVHEVLGLKGSDYQSLYHFTVGGPVIDKRIMSLPAYPGPEIDA
uniref:Nitroreductase domain-containing protein n=1 Tax=Chenopodium quinoa TaxID=63459 RepID=A0A803LI59_CHEQI